MSGDDIPYGTRGPAQHSSAVAVDVAITSRRSIRGFTATPIAANTVRDILAVASRAPSMTNTQPWNFYVVQGAARDRLCQDIVAAHAGGDIPEAEYDYYPREWVEPFLGRRREIGWALYSMLGIAKGDRDATARQHRRNFDFFGAPTGMIFTLHRALQAGSFLDLGMFLQNVMVAARARGLDTCAQAAFMSWHGIIRSHLDIPADEIVICGMALGYADPAEKANALISPRIPVDEFCRFYRD